MTIWSARFDAPDGHRFTGGPVRIGMKQVIVVRGDLDIGPGKLAVQVAHGAVRAAEGAPPPDRNAWRAGGQQKVVLRAPDESALRELQAEATRRNLPTALISDAGRTELPPGTVTVLAIGPAEDSSVDAVTGDLPLY